MSRLPYTDRNGNKVSVGSRIKNDGSFVFKIVKESPFKGYAVFVSPDNSYTRRNATNGHLTEKALGEFEIIEDSRLYTNGRNTND